MQGSQILLGEALPKAGLTFVLQKMDFGSAAMSCLMPPSKSCTLEERMQQSGSHASSLDWSSNDISVKQA